MIERTLGFTPFLLLVATATLLADCGGRAQTPAEETVASVNAGVWIRATPNPIPAGPGRGRTTVSWDAGNSIGQVYVSIGGEPEILFAGESLTGSQEATWIDRGVEYQFRLYAGRDHQVRLASVTVERQRATAPRGPDFAELQRRLAAKQSARA